MQTPHTRNTAQSHASLADIRVQADHLRREVITTGVAGLIRQGRQFADWMKSHSAGERVH